MTQDKDIQELFDSVNIPFADNDDFLETLSQRLEKVEFIKKTQDTQIKRYKASVIYSLIAGIVVGAGSMVLLQALPAVALEKVSSMMIRISVLEMASPIAEVVLGLPLFTGIAAFLIARNYQEIRSVFGGSTGYLKL